VPDLFSVSREADMKVVRSTLGQLGADAIEQRPVDVGLQGRFSSPEHRGWLCLQGEIEVGQQNWHVPVGG